MPYQPIPKPSFLDNFPFYKIISGRKTYRGSNKLYQWDELHGEIEVYDKRGRHLGVLDARTGELIKGAVKGRKIDVS